MDYSGRLQNSAKTPTSTPIDLVKLNPAVYPGLEEFTPNLGHVGCFFV